MAGAGTHSRDRRPDAQTDRTAAQTWVAEAERLRASGLTLQAIADRLDVSRNRVAHWLRPEEHREQTRAWKRRHGYRHPRRRQTPRGKTTSDGGPTVSDVPTLTPTTRITVRMPTALAHALQVVAERNGRTLSQQIREDAKRTVTETFTTTAKETT